MILAEHIWGALAAQGQLQSHKKLVGLVHRLGRNFWELLGIHIP